MRLDHVSYVASHDQISDVVNRIGSQIGTAFIDGGIHPKFGTRNFTAPLTNGQYIEVVCPLDHPATETSPFGRIVKRKAEEGGGWLAWVLSTNKIQEIEKRIGRESIVGTRRLPSGLEIEWKQLGVSVLLDNPGLPFFVEWLSKNHPSESGKPVSTIEKIMLFSNKDVVQDWIGVRFDLLTLKTVLEFHANDEKNTYIGISKVMFKNQDNELVSIE
jgi:hypothetical protein